LTGINTIVILKQSNNIFVFCFFLGEGGVLCYGSIVVVFLALTHSFEPITMKDLFKLKDLFLKRSWKR